MIRKSQSNKEEKVFDMKYVKCPKCGAKTPEVLSFCKNCNERLPKVNFDSNTSIEPLKQRNGFISFWLWVCLVINVLFTIGYFSLMFSSKGGGWTGTPELFMLRLFWLNASVVVVIGYVMLIKWNKTGCYILAGTSIVINGIVSFFIYPSVAVLISAIIPIIVLYYIIQIKKNGESYWDCIS